MLAQLARTLTARWVGCIAWGLGEVGQRWQTLGVGLVNFGSQLGLVNIGWVISFQSQASQALIGVGSRNLLEVRVGKRRVCVCQNLGMVTDLQILATSSLIENCLCFFGRGLGYPFHGTGACAW